MYSDPNFFSSTAVSLVFGCFFVIRELSYARVGKRADGWAGKMYSDPIFRVYKPSKRICIRNINTADSGGVLA